jgi:methylenetetrahydrofolate dehydrogenase (NADP+) / methenyltetrahydrofolate cyclohydrolase
MPAKILSGIDAREAHIPILLEKFKSLKLQPGLAIIQVGDRADSTAYIGAKIVYAKKLGVIAHYINLGEKVSQQEIIQKIEQYNTDPSIQGIIVQLPLPEGIDRDAVIDSILPHKDIDGITSTNTHLLEKNNPTAIIPATVRGIMELLVYYAIEIKGKKITVVGRSALVGKSLAHILSHRGAFVTVAHSQTLDLVAATKDADIIIVAVGKIGLIGREHVRPGQVIIDVGINRITADVAQNNKSVLVGDVDFEAVQDIVVAITPVPGGVGPMTVFGLFENLADRCY